MRIQVVAWGLLLVVSLAGCGGGTSDTVHLSGKVTLDGEPIPADALASITFQPAAGNKGKAVTVPITNGTYDSPNTPRGPVMALISLSIPTGKKVFSERLGSEVPEMKTTSLVPEQAGGIPLDVTADETNQDFELKRAG